MAGVFSAASTRAGEISSREGLMAVIARSVMYKDSDLLAVGTKIIPPQPWPTLDAQWAFPLEVDGEFPVPEGAIASRSRPVYVHFGARMEMAEFRWMITDFHKARQLENWTQVHMQRRGSEYFARCQDQQIINTLYAGAGATAVTVAAGNEWDTNAATVDIEGDIMEAWQNILDESNVSLDEISEVCILYPAKVDARLRGLRLINNIQRSFMDYMGKSFGFSFYPTRLYHETATTAAAGIQDDALMIVKGPDTAIHGVYSGADIPLAESERVMGRGDDYLVKKLFFTRVVPETATVTGSYRICPIRNVI
jgi:hypothetical protein